MVPQSFWRCMVAVIFMSCAISGKDGKFFAQIIQEVGQSRIQYSNETLSILRQGINQYCQPGDYICSGGIYCCPYATICCGRYCCRQGSYCSGGLCRGPPTCPPGYVECYNGICCRSGSPCCGQYCCINGAYCDYDRCRERSGCRVLSASWLGWIGTIWVIILMQGK